MQRIVMLPVILLLSAILSTPAISAEKGVSVGDKTPTISNLPGIDGKKHSLSDYEGKPVAVLFFSNHCPVALEYEDRVVKFAKDYAGKLVLLAINVNRDEDLALMKKSAKKKGYTFPYVYDASQQTAIEFGATCTPHVFLLDKDHKVAYMGAWDDDEFEPKTPYLRNAADAILAGKEPKPAKTEQFGCAIRWKKR